MVSFFGALPAPGVVPGGVTVPGPVVVGRLRPGSRITGSCAKSSRPVHPNKRQSTILYKINGFKEGA